MDTERFNRWVRASRVADKIQPFMIVALQGLGRLDSQLVEQGGSWLEQTNNSTAAIAKSVLLNETFTLSYLWVLGAYELIRTICQRCHVYRKTLGESLCDRLYSLKGDFERLRIPLAKMEPARKYKQTDYPIAYPALHRDLGISWKISENVFISRRELSDSLLSLLEDISAKVKVD